MNRHHPCVGGPLDGQNVAKPDHIKQFNVALFPEQPFALYEPGAAAEAPPVTIGFVTYTLTRQSTGVLEWVAA